MLSQQEECKNTERNFKRKTNEFMESKQIVTYKKVITGGFFFLLQTAALKLFFMCLIERGRGEHIST